MMKNMKKLWALLLALAMCLSLAACGGDDAAEETPADDQTTEEPAEGGDEAGTESDPLPPSPARPPPRATWPMSRTRAPWW